MTTRLVFLGGGNMAEAILSGLVSNPDFRIEVIQRNPLKAQALSACYPQIKVHAQLSEKLAAQDILILAIKPQHAKEACQAITPLIQECLIISVMAALSCPTLHTWCHNQRVVRTMPNTPASVGMGVTAIYMPVDCSLSEQTKIQQIFSGLGLIYLAQDESEIDKMAPVASSAIGFTYYFMEGLIKQSVEKFGFRAEDAKRLVTQAVAGTVALIQATPELSLPELRAQVTSKKGMTEQGILALEENNFHHSIAAAMERCYQRAAEMAKEFE